MLLLHQYRSIYPAYVSFTFNSILKNVLLLYSGLADTIYTIENNMIVPRIILDYGDRKPKLKELWAKGSERMRAVRNSIFIMNPAFETGRYFITKLREKETEYVIVYDKFKKLNRSVVYAGRNEIINGFNDPNIPISNFGFTNDIVGGVDTYPYTMSSDGNYWVSYVDADVMKNLLTDEYFAKRTDVQNKEQQVKLKELVRTINEEDNQILILMKLKIEI